MNLTTNKPAIFVSLLFLLLSPGCSRKGCTDQSAENYDGKAKKTDHSCTYKGDVVFWYGRETSEALVASGAVSLKYYFDEQLVGSTSADVYITGSPDCGMDGTITVSKPLGGNKGGAYSYRVEDQLGFIRFQGMINLVGGSCIKKQLGP